MHTSCYHWRLPFVALVVVVVVVAVVEVVSAWSVGAPDRHNGLCPSWSALPPTSGVLLGRSAGWRCSCRRNVCGPLVRKNLCWSIMHRHVGGEQSSLQGTATPCLCPSLESSLVMGWAQRASPVRQHGTAASQVADVVLPYTGP